MIEAIQTCDGPQVHIDGLGDYGCFDAARALHWFCVGWHNGQCGVLYGVMCALEYRPSTLESGVDFERNEDHSADVYAWLESLPYADACERAQELQVAIHNALDMEA
jgi:hypothetical protein